MKYEIFDVEENRKQVEIEISTLDEQSKIIVQTVYKNVFLTQEISNELHNDKMIEKDIKIEKLQSNIETLKLQIKEML